MGVGEGRLTLGVRVDCVSRILLGRVGEGDRCKLYKSTVPRQRGSGTLISDSNPPTRAHAHPTDPMRHYCGAGRLAHIVATVVAHTRKRSAPSVLSHHSHTAEGPAFPGARPYLKRTCIGDPHAADRRLAVTRSEKAQLAHNATAVVHM